MPIQAYVDTYRLQVTAGPLYYGFNIHPRVMHESWHDVGIATLAIQELVTMMALEHGLPLDAQKQWLLVVGEGLRNVVGKGFRGFRASDFEPKSNLEDPHRVTGFCRGLLVIAEAIPDQCDSLGCRAWATYHFDIRGCPGDPGQKFWGKGPGGTLHACARHAKDAYQMDTYYPSALELRR